MRAIQHTLEWAEKRFGQLVLSVVFSCLLMAFTIAYGAFSRLPFNHGALYAFMSKDPFTLTGIPMQYRILSPLLGYFSHLRGEYFVWFMLLMAFIFLALVYILCRKNDLDPLESVGVMTVLALSTPVLFLVRFSGYTDITTYICIVLILLYRRHVPLVYGIMALAYFNHEMVFFLVPWIAYLLTDRHFLTKEYFKQIALLFLMALPYALFRLYVSSHVPIPVTYDIGYYLDPQNFIRTFNEVRPLFFLGFFESFKLFWFLPIIALIHEHSPRALGMEFILILGGTLAQLAIASDTSRLFGLAFPMFLLAAFSLKRTSSNALLILLSVLILANLLLPNLYIGQTNIIQL